MDNPEIVPGRIDEETTGMYLAVLQHAKEFFEDELNWTAIMAHYETNDEGLENMISQIVRKMDELLGGSLSDTDLAEIDDFVKEAGSALGMKLPVEIAYKPRFET